MKTKKIGAKGLITRNESYEAKPLTWQIRDMLDNKEPIEKSAPLIYTERKDGVLPGYNIRTDRWEIAREAMDQVNKNAIAKRTPKGEKTGAEQSSPVKTKESDKPSL